MGHLILPHGLIDQLGPAVGSGRSSSCTDRRATANPSIAEGIRAAMGDNIYVPHALAYAGQVITLFDPIVHTPIKLDEDGRPRPQPAAQGLVTLRHALKLLCKRPTVMTGGELTLSMLDLN